MADLSLSIDQRYSPYMCLLWDERRSDKISCLIRAAWRKPIVHIYSSNFHLLFQVNKFVVAIDLENILITSTVNVIINNMNDRLVST